MAKLYFRYAAMNAGKSTALMQVAHNYKERGMLALVAKPAVDTKAEDRLSSRIGLERKVDFLIGVSDSIFGFFEECKAGQEVACLLVDESQFLTGDQVDELWDIATIQDVPVICYGLRTDFQMKGFPGSTRLLEIADSIEELKTICRCGKKATCNMRKVDGNAIFAGDQVAIDGDEVTYESVCGSCYVREKNSG